MGSKVRVRIDDVGASVLAVDEVVHHPRLQRTGTKQRDQRHDVAEAIGLKLLDQFLHAARFELEDGGGLASLQEGEGRFVVRIDAVDVERRLAADSALAIDGFHRPIDDRERTQPLESRT